MRFTSIFTGLVAAVSAVQAGVIGARMPSYGTTTKMTRRTMHEFGPRAVDGTVCLTLGPIGAQVVGLGVDVIDNVCLCTEARVLTAESLVDLAAAVRIRYPNGLVGLTVDAIVLLLRPVVEPLVGNSPPTCDYPANSFPRCSSVSSAAGCNFGCDTGFQLCNGQCIGNDDTCGTQARKRDQTAAKICPKSWVACPVFFGTKTEWECVDVTNDLESCGGCATLTGQGVDCTALAGVNDVICVAGQCQATSCLRGFKLDGSSTCVSDTTVKSRRINLL